MKSVIPVLAFEDNYIWLISGQSEHQVAIVDPGDAQPVLDYLAQYQLTPVAILCTHHHWDHVNGIGELLSHHEMPVYGPAQEQIPMATHKLQEGDQVTLDGLGVTFNVLDVPGHTAGHIAFYDDGRRSRHPASRGIGTSLCGMLFCGDTLFSAGCGRLFEGTAAQMFASLSKLAELPATTRVFCAHEYTLSNLDFARQVEPDNTTTRQYRQDAAQRRRDNLPTLPSTIGLERQINPFLRTQAPTVRTAVESFTGRKIPSQEGIFAALRRWKDRFR